jgi:secreted trypsin-like serine protease
MGKRPRLVLLGSLASLMLLVPASASAQADGSAQPKVVGGSTASVSTYPWQAAVVFSPAKRSGNAHQRQFCGGSLLTSRIVITAGHCVANNDPDCTIACVLNDPGGDHTSNLDPNDVDVVLGRDTLTNATQGAEFGVQAVKLGTDFDGSFGSGADVPRFDAAYLVLSSAPAGLSPIKIAGTDEGALWDPGSPVDISGWGQTSESGSTADTLQAASVAVIPDPTCSGDYGSDFDATTMVCAGFQDGGTDTCAGDSGGPLEAALQGGGFRLVGITGWGDGCAEPDAPGVYTRVAGPTMRSLIDSDVSSLEDANGLPRESIFGSGGRPLGSGLPAVRQTASNALKKCKRIHDKKKRRRCVKKAKKRARSRS